MSLERIRAIPNIEENKSFEELGFTRDFGEVSEDVAIELIEKNDKRRIPTIAEFFALKKQNKFGFFKNNYYWATDFVDRDKTKKLMVIKTDMFGISWHFASEVKKPKHLVMIENGTKISGTEEAAKAIEYPY